MASGMLAAVLLIAGMLAVGEVQTSAIRRPWNAIITAEPAGIALLGFITALLGIGLAWGWPSLAALPRPAPARIVMIMTALAAPATAIFASTRSLSYLIAFLVPLTFVVHMVNHEANTKLVRQLSGTYAGALMIIAASAWVFTARIPNGSRIGLIVATILLGACIVSYITKFEWRTFATFLSGMVIGFLMWYLLGSVPWWAVVTLVVLHTALTWALQKVERLLQVIGNDDAAFSLAIAPHCAMGVAGYTLALLAL